MGVLFEEDLNPVGDWYRNWFLGGPKWVVYAVGFVGVDVGSGFAALGANVLFASAAAAS